MAYVTNFKMNKLSGTISKIPCRVLSKNTIKNATRFDSQDFIAINLTLL